MRLVLALQEYRLKRAQRMINNRERMLTAKGKELLCKAMKDQELQKGY